jgi:hypothetical protein
MSKIHIKYLYIGWELDHFRKLSQVYKSRAQEKFNTTKTKRWYNSLGGNAKVYFVFQTHLIEALQYWAIRKGKELTSESKKVTSKAWEQWREWGSRIWVKELFEKVWVSKQLWREMKLKVEFCTWQHTGHGGLYQGTLGACLWRKT